MRTPIENRYWKNWESIYEVCEQDGDVKILRDDDGQFHLLFHGEPGHYLDRLVSPAELKDYLVKAVFPQELGFLFNP